MKTPVFPRHTVQVSLEETQAFRRFSFSLWEVAIVTGVFARLYRLLVLTHGSNDWLYLGGSFALGLIFVLGMATVHLANFPLHQYVWRAPAFALIEVSAEMATSLLLISVGREPMGTVRAHLADWPGMAVNALLIRGIALLLWGLVLAGMVQLVRRTVVHEEEAPESGA